MVLRFHGNIVLNLLLFLALGAGMSSCFVDQCEKDEQFIDKFENYIAVIDSSQNGEQIMPYKELEALIYLEAITGLGADALTESVDIRQSIKHWNAWLKDNKCLMTMEIADSLYLQYTTR